MLRALGVGDLNRGDACIVDIGHQRARPVHDVIEILERAQEECLSDEEQRRIAREKAALARERADDQYVAQFVDCIRSRYPDCSAGEAEAIAKHACEKYSGRVGRSSAAKSFDAGAIDLAVKAHVRHTHTEYDRLLSRGWERTEARSAVLSKVTEIMERWRRG